MTIQQLTDWLDGTAKPARHGVYQKLFDDDVYYSYWNGVWWSPLAMAANQATMSLHCDSTIQFLPWRGLSEKPE